MGVPGVAVNDVGVHTGRVEVRAAANGSEHGVEVLWTTEICRINTESADSQIRLVNFLISEAAYLDIHYLCQFAAQVIDVNTCTPIDIGGILVRQKECFHTGSKESRTQEFNSRFRYCQRSIPFTAGQSVPFRLFKVEAGGTLAQVLI